jgi:arsenite methyltransferase
MQSYLNSSFDLSSPEIISVFDELPLWSSYFGAVLLDKVKFKKDAVILDIGCGTGFPLIEIAQRFGETSTVYGIDPWSAALNRVKTKLEIMNICNVKLIEGEAESLSFENNSFDLIVSNNGINNVKDPLRVMKESFRILKNNGQLVYTVNLPETMNEFYNIFRQCLKEYNLNNEMTLLEAHILSKRKTMQMNTNMITGSGFLIEDITTGDFRMRFIDASAMFNHYFIKIAFLDSWKKILPEDMHYKIFSSLESGLNKYADENNGIDLTIPFACFSCKKES